MGLNFITIFKTTDEILVKQNVEKISSHVQFHKAFFHDKEGDYNRLEIGTIFNWDAKTDI